MWLTKPRACYKQLLLLITDIFSICGVIFSFQDQICLWWGKGSFRVCAITLMLLWISFPLQKQMGHKVILNWTKKRSNSKISWFVGLFYVLGAFLFTEKNPLRGNWLYLGDTVFKGHRLLTHFCMPPPPPVVSFYVRVLSNSLENN